MLLQSPTRRIKCDLVDLECSQCIGADKTCLWYRSQTHLMFRDENVKVLQKVKTTSKPQAKKKSHRNASRTASSNPYGLQLPLSTDATSNAGRVDASDDIFFGGNTSASSIHDNVIEPELTSGLLPAAIEDEGVAFFFTHFVAAISPTIGPSEDPRKAPFWSWMSSSSHFFNAVSCNIAEADLQGALKTVMVSTILCGGKIRKRSVSTEEPLLRMQLQLAFAVWSMDRANAQGMEDMPAAETVGIISLFMKMSQTGDMASSYPRDIIQRALRFEGDCQDWERQFSSVWRYNTIMINGTEKELYGDRYHMYRDILTARISNHYRWCRMLVYNITLQIARILLGSYKYTDLRTESFEITASRAVGKFCENRHTMGAAYALELVPITQKAHGWRELCPWSSDVLGEAASYFKRTRIRKLPDPDRLSTPTSPPSAPLTLDWVID
ncbi:hypothetical protein BJ878DRAFT_578529 [Calycina marina]|uniref:Zn(2)-C6 fungal-type domain-containing protein n=1 Tax=Calycina marina TaxID=1763456 RepID=A0A9P7YWL7_9HELO|nr:hypothetical protein BJ878DRAFT_578529 [Calycina marina]